MPHKNKREKIFRKQILLNRSIISFCIFTGLGVALLTISYTIFAMNIVGYLFEYFNLGEPSNNVVLLSQLLRDKWFYFIFGCILLLGLSALFAQRFTGPLYRFGVSLDRMINRDFGFRMVLRKNDEYKDLAKKINVFNDRMASTFKVMVVLIEEIEKRHHTLQNGVSEKDLETLMEASNLNNRLKMMLSEFKYE